MGPNVEGSRRRFFEFCAAAAATGTAWGADSALFTHGFVDLTAEPPPRLSFDLVTL